jgi:crotonobetainyl-CoA:carnitine CoA-transferase CaiB-like acyl-CoA transferase
MQRFGVPVAPILSIEETVKHPHLVERGTVRTVNDRYAGEFQVPGFPLRFSAFPEPLPLEAATLGEHNYDVVCGLLGRSREEADRLAEAGVLLQQEV